MVNHLMMNKQTSIAYIDLLTALFAFFVIISGLLLTQNHELSKGNVTNKAEFVATLDWTPGSIDDVDIWARNPNGDIVYYNNRDAGLMTLDRDDTGLDDGVEVAGTTITAPIRREVISVRSIMPGQHVFNVMLFSHRSNQAIPVHVEIIKLNPYSIITDKDLVLHDTGEEHTIASFNVEKDGSVDQLDTTDEIVLSRVSK